MKKIVGILAAAALAASVFAVDFTAGMQLKGELFKYDGTSQAITGMKLSHANTKDDKPFVFSLSTDRVGGQLKMFDGQLDVIDSVSATAATTSPTAGTYTTTVTATKTTKKADAMIPAAWQIWFKPFDQVKVELGNTSFGMNTETITYWEGKVLGTADWGWKATATFDAFQVGAGLFAGNGENWFSVPNGGQASIGETAFWAQYSADFGTIKVLGQFKNTFKEDNFAVGYNNKFGDISIFTDAAILLNNSGATSTTGLKADFDIAYAKDAISVQAYAMLGIANFNNVKPTLMTKFKAAYALNGGSLYFKFQDGNIMADNFAANFEVGYDGNLGAMAYNVAGQIDLANNKVNFTVPVSFKLSF